MAGSSGTTPPKGSGQRGGGRRPVDSKTRAKVRKLAREGNTRNAIAKLVGLSPSTVSRICAEAVPPITFDRSKVAVAIEANTIDVKARRAALSIGLLDDLDRLRKMMFEPTTRVHFSVTNGREEYEAQPSSGEIKDLFIAAGIAIDKHLVLVRTDSDDRDLPAVDQWISAMMGRTA